MQHQFRIILLAIFLCIINHKVSANVEGMLPDSLILLPEHTNALLVEKSSQHILLYSFGETEIFEKYRFFCSTGEVPGIKMKSGDKKTPEGVYFIKDRYEDRDLSPIYGKKAFPLDYPNFLDKTALRSGNNIWLHGTNKVLKARDSNGCVAMENDNILKLSQHIFINRTPVVIVDTISMVKRDTLALQAGMIQEWLQSWADAVNNGSYHDYLNLYDDTYLPEILWWKRWYSIRNETKKNIGKFKITIRNIGIYKQNNVYVIIFNMGLNLLKQNVDLGIRKLFIVKKDNNFTIIGDVYQVQNASLQVVAESLVRKVEMGPDIRDIIRKWARVWTDKDMNAYASCYSENFISDGLNKKEWVTRKKNLAERYDYIKVSTSNFNIKKSKNSLVVTFLQDYKSSGFSAIGVKTLIFINEGNRWKIYRESWKKR